MSIDHNLLNNTDEKCRTCHNFWLSFKELEELGIDPCDRCKDQNLFKEMETRPLSNDYLFDADRATKVKRTYLGRIYMKDDEASRIQKRQEGEI
jgi:hypothetical protein